MIMMREPSMIMLIVLAAALATPAFAQTGNILSDDYQIMVPEKGPNGNYRNANSQNHGLRRNINPHAGRYRTYVFPNRKSCARRTPPIRGTSTCHRRDGPFRICRHYRAQVREEPRHLRIAPYVALTKLASTDKSEPIAAATWAVAFNAPPGLRADL